MSAVPRRAAVFLDRDGTLIKAPVSGGKPRAVANPSEVQLTKGAADFCAALLEAGVQLFMVTNQPDVARGLVSRYTVEQINQTVATSLEIADVAVSWADDDSDPLRKPNPGLLLDLAARHDVDLARSVMVGDRWRDVEAGKRAGTATVFIDRSYGERPPEGADLTVKEIGEALEWVLERVTG